MRRFGLLLLAALLCCLGRWTQLHGPAAGRSEHPDEGLWAASGKRAYERLALEHDVSLDEWSDPRLGPFDCPNPSFGKLLVGASLYAHGVVQAEAAISGYEDLGVGLGPSSQASSFPAFDWSELRTRRPGDAQRAAARKPLNWLAAALPALLFLFVSRALGSLALGIAAALSLVARPLFLEQARLALMDAPATTLGLAALLLLVDGPARGTASPVASVGPMRALSAGTLSGLAAATKLTGLFAPALGLAWLALRPMQAPDDPEGLRHRLPPWLVRLRAVVLFGCAALLSFWLANPQLYRAPLAGLEPMLALAEEVPKYDVPDERRLHDLPSRLGASVRIGLGEDAPFAHWAGLPFADAFLACAGLFVLARALRRDSPALSGAVLLCLWSLVSLALVLATTPFDWRRWYVPMEPVWALCSGLGIGLVLHVVFRPLRQLVSPSKRQASFGDG